MNVPMRNQKWTHKQWRGKNPDPNIRQACEGEDVNDIPFDIENLETHNTKTFANAPRWDTPIEDTGSRATPLEREHVKGKSSAYRGDKKADVSLNEEE